MIALGEAFSHLNVGVNPFGGTGLTLSGGHKGIRLLGCRIYLLGFGGTLQITGNPQISDRRECKGLISNKSGAARVIRRAAFICLKLVENSLPVIVPSKLFAAISQQPDRIRLSSQIIQI